MNHVLPVLQAGCFLQFLEAAVEPAQFWILDPSEFRVETHISDLTRQEESIRHGRLAVTGADHEVSLAYSDRIRHVPLDPRFIIWSAVDKKPDFFSGFEKHGNVVPAPVIDRDASNDLNALEFSGGR